MNRHELNLLIDALRQSEETALELAKRTESLSDQLISQQFLQFDLEQFFGDLDQYKKTTDQLNKQLAGLPHSPFATLSEARQAAEHENNILIHTLYSDALLKGISHYEAVEDGLEDLKQQVRIWRENGLKRRLFEEDRTELFKKIYEISRLEDQAKITAELSQLGDELPWNVLLGLSSRSFVFPELDEEGTGDEKYTADAQYGFPVSPEPAEENNAGQNSEAAGNQENLPVSLIGVPEITQQPAEASSAGLQDQAAGNTPNVSDEPSPEEQEKDPESITETEPEEILSLSEILQAMTAETGSEKRSELRTKFDQQAGLPVFETLNQNYDAREAELSVTEKAEKSIKPKKMIRDLFGNSDKWLSSAALTILIRIHNEGFIVDEKYSKNTETLNIYSSALSYLSHRGYLQTVRVEGYEECPVWMLSKNGRKIFDNAEIMGHIKRFDQGIVKRSRNLKPRLKERSLLTRMDEKNLHAGIFFSCLFESQLENRTGFHNLNDKELQLRVFTNEQGAVTARVRSSSCNTVFVALFSKELFGIPRLLTREEIDIKSALDTNDQIIVCAQTREAAEYSVFLLKTLLGTEKGNWFTTDPLLTEFCSMDDGRVLSFDETDLGRLLRKEAEEKTAESPEDPDSESEHSDNKKELIHSETESDAPHPEKNEMMKEDLPAQERECQLLQQETSTQAPEEEKMTVPNASELHSADQSVEEEQVFKEYETLEESAEACGLHQNDSLQQISVELKESSFLNALDDKLLSSDNEPENSEELHSAAEHDYSACNMMSEERYPLEPADEKEMADPDADEEAAVDLDAAAEHPEEQGELSEFYEEPEDSEEAYSETAGADLTQLSEEIQSEPEELNEPERNQLSMEPENTEQEPAEESDEEPAETDVNRKMKEENRISYDEAQYRYNKGFEMIARERFCEGTAIFYALAQERKEDLFSRTALQMGFAMDDPLRQEEYDENRMLEVFLDEDVPFRDYLLASSLLRIYFYDLQKPYYTLQSLYELFEETDLHRSSASLRDLLYELNSFKMNNDRYGLDRFALYHRQDMTHTEDVILALVKKGTELYQQYVNNHSVAEVGRSKAVKYFYTRVFKADNDLPTFLKAVADNDTSHLEDLTELAAEEWIRKDAVVCSAQLDSGKIAKYVDDLWDEARKTKDARKVDMKTKLCNPVRITVIKTITSIISVVTDWLYQNSKARNDSEGSDTQRYVTECAKLPGMIDAVIQEQDQACQPQENPGWSILKYTLEEIRDKAAGQYPEDEKNYYYFPFAAKSHVFLNEQFVPYLCEPNYLPGLAASKRILNHFEDTSPDAGSWNDRIQELYSSDDSSFGTIRRIAEYSDVHPADFSAEDLSALTYYDQNMSKALIMLDRNWEDFISELELSRAYGQLDQTKVDQKELFAAEGSRWRLFAEKTGYFGFFSKVAGEFKKQIRVFSEERARVLQKTLDEYTLSRNGQLSEEQEKATDVIKRRLKDGNYTAAEDMINQLSSGKLDNSFQPESSTALEDFIREYSSNLMQVKKLQNRPLLQILNPNTVRNKEMRWARQFLSVWPTAGLSGKLRKERIQELLDLLEFRKSEVTPLPDANQFEVRAVDDSDVDSGQTPLAAFQSAATVTPFQVMVLFGRRQVDDLISLSKKFRAPALLFLDHALTLDERRKLARKSKEDYHGYPFLVIDQVAAVFLAFHYQEFQINRILMEITAPFAYYQPYVQKASEYMPLEMFIGREKELRSIIDPGGANIVYGGRQLGKSALLRRAKTEKDHPSKGEYAVYTDLKSCDYQKACSLTAKRIVLDTGLFTDEEAEEIGDDWQKLTYLLEQKLNEGSPVRCFLLLMDEADLFLETGAEVAYEPISILKALETSSQGRFKFVIAGLRNVVRFSKKQSLSENSPLPHLSAITVTPFGYSDGKKLLTMPLQMLGFRFPQNEETETLIATILAETNYFPGMIQLYGFKLVESMRREYGGFNEFETPPYLIGEEQFRKILKDDSLSAQIRKMFEITLSLDTDDYYLILANLIAYLYHEGSSAEGSTVSEIEELASSLDIDKISGLSEEQIDALLQEMCELNLLRCSADNRYRFSRNNFLQMMGTQKDIEDVLNTLIEEEK